jgi:hypothetical protein
MNEQVSMKMSKNEWVNEWMNINGIRMSTWVSEERRIRVTEWMSKWVWKWVRMNEWMNINGMGISKWVSEKRWKE